MLPIVARSSAVRCAEESNSSQERHLRGPVTEVHSGAHLNDGIAHTIETWLLLNYPPTAGESTATIYRKLLTSLRAYLWAQALDLDSPESQLIPHIQTWANLRTSASKGRGSVAPATYNQRIAAISSFYTWVRERGLYHWPDPTSQLRRTAVRKYAGSQALDLQQVHNQLKKIDQSTARGQRDYVLLQVALNTGRSAHELASLTWGSLSFTGEGITFLFKKSRGGKVLKDTLDSRLSQTLFTYLRTIYGEGFATPGPQSPIWISFSDRTYGQAIGPQTIADICGTHLGVSQVHRLRHTFAFALDQLGAPIDTIQTRLGHENRTTTAIYLASLKNMHDPYAKDRAGEENYGPTTEKASSIC